MSMSVCCLCWCHCDFFHLLNHCLLTDSQVHVDKIVHWAGRRQRMVPDEVVLDGAQKLQVKLVDFICRTQVLFSRPGGNEVYVSTAWAVSQSLFDAVPWSCRL